MQRVLGLPRIESKWLIAGIATTQHRVSINTTQVSNNTCNGVTHPPTWNIANATPMAPNNSRLSSNSDSSLSRQPIVTVVLVPPMVGQLHPVGVELSAGPKKPQQSKLFCTSQRVLSDASFQPSSTMLSKHNRNQSRMSASIMGTRK